MMDRIVEIMSVPTVRQRIIRRLCNFSMAFSLTALLIVLVGAYITN